MFPLIALNIFCSVIASFIFLFLVLYLLRPKISISTYICKQVNTFDDSTANTYVFKIINESYFSAFDVQLELFKLEQYRVTAKGINNRIKPIAMQTNEIKHIPNYISSKKCNKRSFAPHAIMFRTNEVLEEILKNEKETLQLQITLRHGLTGLSRVYHKDYITIDDIKEGQFKFGNSIDIDVK
ncbi:hypothetical protein [Pedobacter arcticus]|uniref:hypothetical protein n=1 Tax=Pedobacter arcticus TaxID=752140 RepID=UPI0012B610FD|nr:hypothetical protein [Pedobacter arcticus]